MTWLRNNFQVLAAIALIIAAVAALTWFLAGYSALAGALGSPVGILALASAVVVTFLLIVWVVNSFISRRNGGQRGFHDTGPLLLLGTVYVGVLLLFPLLIRENGDGLLPPQVLLVFLLIGGVIALLQVLGLLTAIFSKFNLNDRKEALGLPAGSVRAMIALVLLLIFAIFIFYLFGAARGQSEVLEGLTASQIDSILSIYGRDVADIDVVTSEEGGAQRYNITIHTELSEAAQDIGGQILTTLGTLATAIAAFYFGTRSADSGTVSPITPAIEGFLANSTTRAAVGDTVTFTLMGRNFNVGSVALEGPVQSPIPTQVPVRVLSATPTQLSCELIIPVGTPVGIYSVVVTNIDGTEARNPTVTFEVV